MLQAHKDPTQRSLEARLRNARYIAELTKFRLAPVGTFFSLLKGLLDDFGGHNVDAAAALVETAGRFLFCQPETQPRIGNMLDVSCGLACLSHWVVHRPTWWLVPSIASGSRPAVASHGELSCCCFEYGKAAPK